MYVSSGSMTSPVRAGGTREFQSMCRQQQPQVEALAAQLRESFQPSGEQTGGTDLMTSLRAMKPAFGEQSNHHLMVFSDGQNDGPVTFPADCDCKVLSVGLGQEQSIPMVHRDALADAAAGYLMA